MPAGGQAPHLAVRPLRGIPAEFPHTTRLAALLYPSLDEQFAFGMEVLIAGLRQRVSRLPKAGQSFG